MSPNIDYNVIDDLTLEANFNAVGACDWAYYGIPCKAGYNYTFEDIVHRFVMFGNIYAYISEGEVWHATHC